MSGAGSRSELTRPDKFMPTRKSIAAKVMQRKIKLSIKKKSCKRRSRSGLYMYV